MVVDDLEIHAHQFCKRLKLWFSKGLMYLNQTHEILHDRMFYKRSLKEKSRLYVKLC